LLQAFYAPSFDLFVKVIIEAPNTTCHFSLIDMLPPVLYNSGGFNLKYSIMNSPTFSKRGKNAADNTDKL
jgi:hypothetical protein